MAMGRMLDALMAQFGPDWAAALTKIHRDGLLEDVMAGRVDLAKLAKSPDMKALRKWEEILKFDPSEPRDTKGQWTRGAGRTPLEQKRRDFMALVKRTERKTEHYNRMRMAMLEGWKVWSEDLKNRKKRLKPDGAAAC